MIKKQRKRFSPAAPSYKPCIEIQPRKCTNNRGTAPGIITNGKCLGWHWIETENHHQMEAPSCYLPVSSSPPPKDNLYQASSSIK